MGSLRNLGTRLQRIRDIRRNDGSLSALYETVMIETTSTCNLDCPICPARRSDNIIERATKQVKLEDVRRIVDLTRHMTQSYCLNMWGEPLLHKEFMDIVRYVSGPGLPINFSTNLNYSPRLARELAQFPLLHIICSVDGWDDDSYAEYRWGGRFDFVRQNLAILGQGKCTVYPQYLVSDDHDDPEGRKRKFLAFVQDTIGTTKNVLFKKKQADLRNDTGAHVPGRCSSLYGGLYFNSDGTLMPCCTNVGKDVMLRHISTYTSEELRGGADIASLRRRILDDKDQFASCRSCAGEDVQQVTLTAIAHRVKGMFISLRPLPGTSKSL